MTEIEQLKAEVERLTRASEIIAAELATSEESRKHARILIKELMKRRGLAAHVVLKIRGDGIHLTVCAPPLATEKHLAKVIWSLLRGTLDAAGIDLNPETEADAHGDE